MMMMMIIMMILRTMMQNEEKLPFMNHLSSPTPSSILPAAQSSQFPLVYRNSKKKCEVYRQQNDGPVAWTRISKELNGFSFNT